MAGCGGEGTGVKSGSCDWCDVFKRPWEGRCKWGRKLEYESSEQFRETPIGALNLTIGSRN